MKVTVEFDNDFGDSQLKAMRMMTAEQAKEAVYSFGEKLRSYDRYANLGPDVEEFVSELRDQWFAVCRESGAREFWLD